MNKCIYFFFDLFGIPSYLAGVGLGVLVSGPTEEWNEEMFNDHISAIKLQLQPLAFDLVPITSEIDGTPCIALTNTVSDAAAKHM
eukprot:UC1_evm1s848